MNPNPLPVLLPQAIAQQLPIATDAQGQSTTSARALYAFLKPKTRFNDWINNRIKKYGLLENVDYVQLGGFTKILVKPPTSLDSVDNPDKGGRPELDYALTIDTAKELCMVENNEQGRQARRYFIQAEKALRQLVSQPLGPVQDVLLGQSQRIADLEDKLSQMLDSQQQAVQALLAVPRSSEPVPTESTRAKIQRILNAYCQAKALSQQEVWRKVYERLYYVYKVRIRSYKKRSDRESWLDVAERNGHIDKLYAIVSADLLVSQ